MSGATKRLAFLVSRDFFTRNAIGPRRTGAEWDHADALNRTARPRAAATAGVSAFARSFLGGRPNLRVYSRLNWLGLS